VPASQQRDLLAAAELLKALANPLRLAIVRELVNRQQCVHELVKALASPQPLVSQHLRVLRAARLVSTERRGREVVYSLADEHVAHIVADAITHSHERTT
jgi:ArsR family transcriptional regulator, zinc-responsive transcriptional repressor